MVLVPSFTRFLQPFSHHMTRPSYASFCTLVGGWIFAARHHVTGSLRAVHQAERRGRRGTPKHFGAYHRVFAAAQWSLDAVGLALLAMILNTALVLDKTVFLVIDDTLCAKCGRRMFGVDSHYDAANTSRRRSNSNQSLKRRGHCWVLLGVLIPLPFTVNRFVCLPVLFRLYMNTKAACRNKTRYRSRPELARELLNLVCAQHPRRCFHALVDSAYAGQDTLRQLPVNCQLTARWQMNVKLCEPLREAPGEPLGKSESARRKTNRRNRHGALLPKPHQMLDAPRCERLNVELYGKSQQMRIDSRLACLFTVPERLLRLLAVEPLTASGKPRHKYRAFYYSTDTNADATQVLQWYALRWTIEVAIHDAKQQMGFNQPQGWSKPAALRTAPTLMLLYSTIVLWFTREGHTHYRKPIWPWYRHKTTISFADMLVTLRLQMLRHHLKQNLSEENQTETADQTSDQNPRKNPCENQTLHNPLKKQGSKNPLRMLLRLAHLAA